MKPTHLRRVAMHALLALASASAQAELVSPSTELDGAEAASPDSSLSFSLSLSAWDSRGAVRPGTAFALAVALPGGGALADGSLRATANAVGSLTLPNSSTASLWTFITSVRAQQRGDTFSVLETNLILMAESLPPSQVPLPAAAWFLVMGLLGMAGVKLTGQRTRRNDLATGAEPALA